MSRTLADRMPTEPPRVSAIVPTIALTDHGRRCIAALVERPGVEVVLVPDERPEDLDPRVVCVPSGPANTSVKRQRGLEASSGDYIALIDDDAFPADGWPEAAIAELERESGIAGVAGPTLTPDDEPELGQVSFRIYASPLVSGPHRWRYAQVPARDVDDAPSVNLVLRRADAERVRLDTPWSFGEDTVVCERLVREGRRIRYTPELVVLHSRRPLWRAHLRQLFRWSRRRGAFARAGGVNSLRPSYFAPTALLLGLASRPVLPRRLRPLWTAGTGVYVVAVVVAGHDRRWSRWWRTSAGIAATHVTYGAGFALSFLGLPLPEARE
jgi:glycosyltransferase involved in cell wall biosynthesis